MELRDRHLRQISPQRLRKIVLKTKRLMAPFFTFVVLASGGPLTASMGKEHYELTNALQKTEEPEFTEVVRKRLSGIASRWLTTFAKPAEPA